MGIECDFDINKFIKNETRKDYKQFYLDYFKFIDKDLKEKPSLP